MPNTGNLFVIDVETTGPNPVVHDPLAIALVPLGNESGVPFVANVVTPGPVWTDYAAENFKKFRDEWAASKRPAEQVAVALERYLSERLAGGAATLIGHNVGFDMAFLRKLAALAGRTDIAGISHRAIDTHTLLYVGWLAGKLPESVLSSDGAFEYLHIPFPAEKRHTALHDALATRELFLRLLDVLSIDIWSAAKLAEGSMPYDPRRGRR